jgi:glucokinase
MKKEVTKSMMNVRPNGPVAALDVGGTSVKSVLVADDGNLVGQLKTTPIDNQASADIILKSLTDIVKGHIQELGTKSHQLLGIALGFPGPFEYEAGISRIQGVAKFEALYGLDVRKGLQCHLNTDNLPIRFRNDAEAAIVGEGLYGAGRPFARLIGLTLGTGCGSAFLINGQPVTTGAGVPPNGWLYPKSFRGRQADDVFSIRGLIGALQAEGVVVNDIKTATDLARQNHQTVHQVFTQFGHNLGAFLRPWAEAFQADAILLQGGIANAFDLFDQELSATLPVTVVRGELEAKAALLGAAALFFHPPKAYKQS